MIIDTRKHLYKYWIIIDLTLFQNLLSSPLIILPCSSNSKEAACDAGDLGSIPGSGRSSGEGNGNPLQYSCLENPWIEEPGGLQSVRLQRVRHNWANSTTPTNNPTTHIYFPSQEHVFLQLMYNGSWIFHWVDWPLFRYYSSFLLLLLSHFSRVRLCATP